MLRIKDEALRSFVKRMLEDSDDGDAQAYIEYRKFCEKFDCPAQDEGTFMDYKWDENDDVGNLFKYVSALCYGRDAEDFAITDYGDFSLFLFRQYLEEKPSKNTIPSIRFISPIPYWVLYFANIFYKLYSEERSVNQQFLTIQIMLSNYDERYWKTESPPKWEQKEQELLFDLCSYECKIIDPMVQFDGKELFRMLYYRTDNADDVLISKLRKLASYSTKTLSEEMDILLNMENSQERSRRLTKLLGLLDEETMHSICKHDLYKIVGDELEELANREKAIELCKEFRSQDDLFCFISLSKNTPKSIQQKCFDYASQILFDYSNDSINQGTVAKQLFDAAMNFSIEDGASASSYIRFLKVHLPNIQREYNSDEVIVTDLFYKLTDHTHEIGNSDSVLLTQILDKASPEYEIVAIILPQYMESIKKTTTKPSDILVQCFAKHYRIIYIMESLKHCPPFKKTKKIYEDFFFWYLHGKEVIDIDSAKEILLSRAYFDFERLDLSGSMSNIDYFFNYFLHHLETDTNCLIYVLCEYIHHGIPIPDQKNAFKKIKNSLRLFPKQNRCIIVGLVSLISPKKAFKMLKTLPRFFLPFHEAKQYYALMQYGVLHLLEYIFDNHPEHNLGDIYFSNDVVDNVMVQTIYKRVIEKFSATYL